MHECLYQSWNDFAKSPRGQSCSCTMRIVSTWKLSNQLVLTKKQRKFLSTKAVNRLYFYLCFYKIVVPMDCRQNSLISVIQSCITSHHLSWNMMVIETVFPTLRIRLASKTVKFLRGLNLNPWMHRRITCINIKGFQKCHWALISLSVILIWIHTWLLQADKALKCHGARIVKTLKPAWALFLNWMEGCFVCWRAIRIFKIAGILKGKNELLFNIMNHCWLNYLNTWEDRVYKAKYMIWFLIWLVLVNHMQEVLVLALSCEWGSLLINKTFIVFIPNVSRL